MKAIRFFLQETIQPITYFSNIVNFLDLRSGLTT
jgi:hypothetical protein